LYPLFEWQYLLYFKEISIYLCNIKYNVQKAKVHCCISLLHEGNLAKKGKRNIGKIAIDLLSCVQTKTTTTNEQCVSIMNENDKPITFMFIIINFPLHSDFCSWSDITKTSITSSIGHVNHLLSNNRVTIDQVSPLDLKP
jgi:hypothetical protein